VFLQLVREVQLLLLVQDSGSASWILQYEALLVDCVLHSIAQTAALHTSIVAMSWPVACSTALCNFVSWTSSLKSTCFPDIPGVLLLPPGCTRYSVQCVI
jgi:hypothetical protein